MIAASVLLSTAAYAHPATKMPGGGYGFWEYRATPPSKTPAMTWMPTRAAGDARQFDDPQARSKSRPTSHFTK